MYSTYRALEAWSWNAVSHRTEGASTAPAEVVVWLNTNFPGTHGSSLKRGVATWKSESLGWRSGPERRGDCGYKVPSPVTEGPCANDFFCPLKGSVTAPMSMNCVKSASPLTQQIKSLYNMLLCHHPYNKKHSHPCSQGFLGCLKKDVEEVFVVFNKAACVRSCSTQIELRGNQLGMVLCEQAAWWRSAEVNDAVRSQLDSALTRLAWTH